MKKLIYFLALCLCLNGTLAMAEGEAAPSAEGEPNPNAKPGKDAKPSSKPDKNKPKKDKNAKQGVFDDVGDDEDWFKMTSEAGTGAEVDSLDDVPADYRGLVRDYFDALNKGGKKK